MIIISASVSVLVVIAAIITYTWFARETPDEICWENHIARAGIVKCKPRCGYGDFGLHGMTSCHPWLTCEDWDEVKIDSEDLIGQGLVKKAYKGKWRGVDVVANHLSDQLYQADFDHGYTMLKGFQHSACVVQLVGRCNNTFLTEFHEGKSANNIPSVLHSIGADWKNPNKELLVRFNFCINYVEILRFLHDSPLGVRVMCDSNDLEKTLDQYLLTDDLRLLVNDLDALPEVIHSNGTLIKCGRRELQGEFVAPEQTWPHEGIKFDDRQMESYDEKTDIWKIPDVCNYFLHDVKHSRGIKLRLIEIHQRCKDVFPRSRPSAGEVLRQYRTVRDLYLVT